MTSRTFFILELPAALCAEKSLGSWSNLHGLEVGQGIEVIESSMGHHSGEFVTVSDDVATLQEKGSDVSVKREYIVRVDRIRRPARRARRDWPGCRRSRRAGASERLWSESSRAGFWQARRQRGFTHPGTGRLHADLPTLGAEMHME